MFRRVLLVPSWCVGVALALALALGACSSGAFMGNMSQIQRPNPNGNPTPTPNGGPTPAPTPPGGTFHIWERAATITANPDQKVTVTAQCNPGEQLVSGGYVIPGGYGIYAAYASFPSSLTTWTVSAYNLTGYSMPVNAYAYCLQASFLVNTSIQQSSALPFVGCPTGVATGGGFRLSVPIGEVITQSRPLPSDPGWFIQAIMRPGAPPGIVVNVFAICATAHVAAGSIPVAFFNVPAYSGGGSTNTTCPAGQTLVGGGYSTFDGGAFLTTAFQFDGDNDTGDVLKSWSIGVTNNDPVNLHTFEVYTVCELITP